MENRQNKSFKQILIESIEKAINVFKRLSKPLKSIGLIMLGFTLATISPCARSPDVQASNFQADQFVIVPSARASFTFNGTYYKDVQCPTMFLEMVEGLVDGDLTPKAPIRLVQPPFEGAPTDYYEISMYRTGTTTNGTFNYIASALQNSYFYCPDYSNEYLPNFNRVITVSSTLFVIEMPVAVSIPQKYPNQVNFVNSNFGFEIGDSYVGRISSSRSLTWEFLNGTELLYRFSLNWSEDLMTTFRTTGGTYGFATLNPKYLPSTQQAYDMGYAEGFYRGQLSVEPDMSPFDALVNAVNSFLSLEILPNVTLRIVFFVGFGLVLFGFLIKIFLGG